LTSSYIDKTSTPVATKPASTADLKISWETDRVYQSVPGPIKISEGGKPRYEVTRENLDDVVVWNPWTEKSKGMADFGPADGYKQMSGSTLFVLTCHFESTPSLEEHVTDKAPVCVEAGAVNGWQKLDPGDAFEGGQIIRSLL
jgi:glucose-6-phosphate 1-epimerase